VKNKTNLTQILGIDKKTAQYLLMNKERMFLFATAKGRNKLYG